MIFAWMTYNYTTKGYFVFSTSAATNVIGRHAVYALSSSQDITIEAAEQQLFDSMLESSLADSNSFSNWNENPTFLKENLDFAQEMILTHWKGYATSYTIGLMRTVFSPPVGLSIASHYFPGSTKIDEADIGDVQNTVLKSPIQVSRSFKKRLQNMSSPAIVFFMFGITYMFGLYHVFFRPVLWQRSNLREIWILIATILYFIVVTGPMGHARFRVPIEPFLIILFSYTLYKAARRTLDDG